MAYDHGPLSASVNDACSVYSSGMSTVVSAPARAVMVADVRSAADAAGAARSADTAGRVERSASQLAASASAPAPAAKMASTRTRLGIDCRDDVRTTARGDLRAAVARA